MKKLLAVVLGLLVATTAIFAEKTFEESDYSYLNIPILKIFEHNSAYVIIYQAHGVTARQVAIPKAWFKQGTGERIGKIRKLPQGLQPYVTLVYRGGEFSNIYLTIPSNHADSVWGTLHGNDSQLPAQIDPTTIASTL